MDDNEILNSVSEGLVNYIRDRQEKCSLSTKESFVQYANRWINQAPDLYDGFQVSDGAKQFLLKEMFEKVYISHSMETGVGIHAEDFTSWLFDKKDEINFRFWNRFVAYLKNKPGWTDESIEKLDEDSDKVLDFAGDPTRNGEWHRRGLMIGDIQAGKTANYTAVINKAADVGYKIIIVLTGMTENLRIQTQNRFDTDFVGIVNNKPAGVGLFDHSKGFPTPFERTTAKEDFNVRTANSQNYPLGQKVSLFVLKKNQAILNRLLSWLAEFSQKTNMGKIPIPVLFVDDECDYASVNTQDNDLNPTAINTAIRAILKKFSRTSYLAVSATPFANIFIDSETENEALGDDLFPADYIYLLRAAEKNPNYLGSTKLFVDFPTPPYNRVLVDLDPEEVEQYLPIKHKKDLYEKINGIADLPPSLIDALRYFLLVQGVMDCFPSVKGKHRSMLINVSRFTKVQSRIKKAIQDWLDDDVLPSVNQYAQVPEMLSQLGGTEYYNLYLVWKTYHLAEITHMDWATYSCKYLSQTINQVKVCEVNQSKEAEELDFDAHKGKGIRIIAVGGLSLSRGLTLEGLVVSYFYRNTKSYDTLMQMGRWFGYRGSYIKLFKIWMTQEAQSDYQSINEAVLDLKVQIERMNELKQRPQDFGLMVRRNSYTQLIITSRNKMRHANMTEKIPIAIAGHCIETPRLCFNSQILEENSELVHSFVKEVSRIGVKAAPSEHLIQEKDALWHRIPKKTVAQFVRNFKTDKFSLNYQAEPLADYIENDLSVSDWDVGFSVLTNESVCGRDTFEVAYGTISVPIIGRGAKREGDILKVGDHSVRIGSSIACRLGMTEEEYARRRAKNNKDHGSGSLVDSNLLFDRKTPILILYSISVYESSNKGSKPKEPFPDVKSPIYGIGLGFASSSKERPTGQSFVYFENTVAQRQNQEIEEFAEDDADEE